MMNQTQLNVFLPRPKPVFCELTILLSRSLLDQSFTKLVEWQDVSKVSQRPASSFCANLAGIEAKRERIGFLIPTSQPPPPQNSENPISKGWDWEWKKKIIRQPTTSKCPYIFKNFRFANMWANQAGSDFWTTSIPAKTISRWQDCLRLWDLILLSSSHFLPFKMSPGLIIKVDEGVLHDDVVFRIRQNSLSRASLDKLKLLGHLWTPTWS